MKFYESEYEEALINLLTDAGWEYTHGSTLHRNNREVLIEEDLRAFLGSIASLSRKILMRS